MEAKKPNNLARINVASGVVGAILSVLILRVWGAEGLIAMVLTAPLLTFLLGHLYVARLGPPAGPRPRFSEMLREGGSMAQLGIAFIHQCLLDYRDQGGAVLLVSEELDEILTLADRIIVIYSGELRGELTRGGDVETIGRMMLGEAA